MAHLSLSSLFMLMRMFGHIDVLTCLAGYYCNGYVLCAQVLLNDQTFRQCAVFFESPALCQDLASQDLLGLGGWQRHVKVTEPHVEGERQAASPGTETAAGPAAAPASTALFPYALHEYGLSNLPRPDCEFLHGRRRVNDFSAWPGLSLNPGVTDLHRLKALLRDGAGSGRCGKEACCSGAGAGSASADAHGCGGHGEGEREVEREEQESRGAGLHEISCLSASSSWFDSDDVMFEHSFSLKAHASGANMAFLPLIAFQHGAGAFESAYRLQGVQRRWDNATAPP
jgi:hypothetical protein